MCELSQWSDKDLVHAFRQGVGVAGDELTRRYYTRVSQLSLQYLHDHHDSQDVAQEVFYKIIVRRKLVSFRGEARLWTWLYRITLNACRTHLQKKKRSRYVHFEDYDQGAWIQNGHMWPEEPALVTERRIHLEHVLRQLPLKYQKALRMTCLEDRSCRETARILNVPVQTLRVHINRGKNLLIRILRSRTEEYNKPTAVGIPDLSQVA